MHYDIDKFIKERHKEKMWLNSNGYENGDPHTNGEYSTMRKLGLHVDLFIDIGANIGDYTKEILKYHKNSSLLLFEANPNLINHLQEINEVSIDNIFNIALGDDSTDIELNLNQLDHTSSSVYDRTHMMPNFIKHTKKVKVKMEILDFWFDKINTISQKGLYIKIDTEGAEFSIMKGSKNIFNLKKPIFVQFEYGHGWKEANSELKDAIHFLNKNNFNIYRITPYGLELIKFHTIDMDNYMYCNYIAVKNINMDNIFQDIIEIPNKNATTKLYKFNL